MGKNFGSLSNYKDFSHIIAGEKKLERSVVVEKIFDVAVIEDALQTELRSPLQTQIVESIDMVTKIRRVWTGILGVEEGQQIAFWIHD